MNKKIIISLLVILCIVFSFSICFANNENGLQKAADDVRNVVGGAENTIENAAKDISNASKDATGSLENDMNEKTNSNNNNDNNQKTDTTRSNSNYNTTRVSTNNVMGMTQNAWTWLIVGIAAIAIIAVIWYYSMQLNTTSRHYHDNNDDE